MAHQHDVLHPGIDAVVEQVADEVGALHDGRLRGAENVARGALAVAAGRQVHGAVTGGQGHVHLRQQRAHPGVLRLGDHAPGGAEHREPALDAETRVEGAQRRLLAAGDAHRDAHGALWQRLAHGGGDHAPRHRVDGRLAGRELQAGPGDGADPRAGGERDRVAVAGDLHLDHDGHAVGDVGVVARVLEHGRAGPRSAEALQGLDRQGHRLAVRQRHGDRLAAGAVRGAPAGQRRRRGLGGAAAQVPVRQPATKRDLQLRRPPPARAAARSPWRRPAGCLPRVPSMAMYDEVGGHQRVFGLGGVDEARPACR